MAALSFVIIALGFDFEAILRPLPGVDHDLGLYHKVIVVSDLGHIHAKARAAGHIATLAAAFRGNIGWWAIAR
jgi:hypothetical protein